MNGNIKKPREYSFNHPFKCLTQIPKRFLQPCVQIMFPVFVLLAADDLLIVP